MPKPLPNSTRRNLLEKFGLPEGNEARCPKLDPIIKGELPKEAVDTDKILSRLQNLALDATGPLVHATSLETISNRTTWKTHATSSEAHKKVVHDNNGDEE